MTVRDILNLKNYILKILTNLVNIVLRTGTFPEELKISKICPIFKSGNRDCVNNYRPISVISVFSKIIEKIVKKRITGFIEKYIQVDQFQYGFVKNSSTLSATLDFINHVSGSLDEGLIVVAVFVDLRKAFDVVNIDILLRKLEHMGFRGIVYNLIKSYLIGRKQYVRLGDVNSNVCLNECGVPQGSVLGPLLYTLYVLNLRCARLKASYYTFADDTVLVYTGREERALNNTVNSDLNLYLNWLYYNKLKINIDKTNFITFKQKNKHIQNLNIQINNLRINEVQHIKYLGLQIDNNLQWTKHIDYITSKIIPMIPIIYRCRNYLTNKTKHSVYNAFFLSHFRYLLPIWGSCCKTYFDSAQILQNKILKILFNYDRLTNTDLLYNELCIPRLSIVLELEQIKLMFKILNKTQRSNTNIIMSNNVHSHDTRSQNNIYQLYTRTNIGLNNPFVLSSKAFNNVPQNLRSIKNYRLFVKHIKIYLGIK